MIYSDRKIVIITDCIDIAFNEMHQALLNELASFGISSPQISPIAQVKNFSVVNAAFIIRLLADLYPAGTLFAIIVSGTSLNPMRLFGETKTGITFVGNNSGYLNWLVEDFGLNYLYENKINRDIEGRSFGGKYAQIPTVARLYAYQDLDSLGIKRDETCLHNFNIKTGTVVHCDNFGLMKIKAPKITDLNEGDLLKIFLNEKFILTAHYTEKMKLQKDGEWVLFTGSSLYGLPELGRVRSLNSSAELGAKEGDIITWDKVSTK